MTGATYDYDVLIIGGGLAGLSVALNLPSSRRIALVSKLSLDITASGKAQGGIAAVLDPDDHTDNHIRDTLVAGAGLCILDSVAHIVEAAPAAIDWLRRCQVEFTLGDSAQLHLTREAGHSHRRIVHAADSTGLAVTSVLQAQLRQRPNVDLYEHTLCVDALIKHRDGQRPICHGIQAVDTASGQTLILNADHTILATGGLGQLFPYTTNPETATGDGQAIAWRAGCRISNLEFVQFHPTALAMPGVPTFLISEAVRGEGGILRNREGHRFMPDYDSRAELAPRDIVARAVHSEIAKQQGQPVWLDISHHSADFIRTHFPTIEQTCREYGLDITREPIPIAPAAHYSCGGVLTDLYGQTDVAGLYAVGEVADTGLHGANRLASNSLLECMVIGKNCAQVIADHDNAAQKRIPAGDLLQSASAAQHSLRKNTRTPCVSEDQPLPTPDDLRQLMGTKLGILRSTSGINQALAQLEQWREQLAHVCKAGYSPAALNLRNQLDCAWLIASCAAQRPESRGLHALADYPDMLSDASSSVVRAPVLESEILAESESG